MGCRVLRTDIDHIVIGTKQSVLLTLQVAVLVQIELQSVVGLNVVFKGVFVVELPVFTEGIALEVCTQEQSTHILVPQEHDTIKVVDLAFQQVGYAPDI